MMGQLPNSGLGKPVDETNKPAKSKPAPIPRAKDVAKPKQVTTRSELEKTRLNHNEKLLSELMQDKHSIFLLEEMRNDAKLGRMTSPVLANKVDLSKVLLASRFSCEQGAKADGSGKLRAVDDETDCGLNGATNPSEKLTTEHID